jgi:hypothetical protein
MPRVEHTCGCGQTHLVVIEVDLEPLAAQLKAIRTTLRKQGRLMATEAAQLTALSAKVDDLIGDVRAALDKLSADRDQLGPEGQAALDQLTAKVDAFDAEVGDADGSDTPPVVDAPVEVTPAE